MGISRQFAKNLVEINFVGVSWSVPCCMCENYPDPTKREDLLKVVAKSGRSATLNFIMFGPGFNKSF